MSEHPNKTSNDEISVSVSLSSQGQKKESQPDPPLCVDLDGTLIKTDILVESIIVMLKHNVLYVFLLPVWLWKGRANLKYQIAIRVELDVTVLPYNEPFLAFLRSQHSAKRRLVLCTATNEKYARQIAEHLQIFDDILASDDRRNLSGLEKLNSICELFGEDQFDYAANAAIDLEIWRHASRAILVNSSQRIRAEAESVASVEHVFSSKPESFRQLIKAIRMHQWLKNILVFLPLLASHQYGDMQSIILSMLAFLAYSLCASSVYILNDLLDLTADRHHPRKRYRPFASGALPLTLGAALVPLLLAGSIAVAILLPVKFLVIMLGYYLISVNYSLWIKRIPILDVLVLAGLYTLRILAGAAAISVTPSFWLLSFSMFFFLSIALAKRYTELINTDIDVEKHTSGRQYRGEDLGTLISQGASSGHVAVLILALYINSEEISRYYTTPEAIWLLCPLLLYWISKLWLNTQRREVHDDPLVWALRNRVSRGIAVLCVVILLLAF